MIYTKKKLRKIKENQMKQAETWRIYSYRIKSDICLTPEIKRNHDFGNEK